MNKIPVDSSPAPVACPFCDSRQIATTGKVAADSSYWRCLGCGQIWNPARLQPPRRW